MCAGHPLVSFAQERLLFIDDFEGGTSAYNVPFTLRVTGVFAEAEALSKAISEHQSPPIEWLDDSGKSIARQLGPMKAVRPMPVACDTRVMPPT